MHLHTRRIPCLLVAGLLGAGALVAQQSTGGLRGRVSDKASGAPKAGVLVTIEHTGTSFTRSASSASDGGFRFPVLPIGNYRITFKGADAMGSMIRTVQLGQETDCSMALAPKAEATVTVVATADTVAQANMYSAEVGVNVSAERLESLPVLSRNVVQATVLAAGVQVISGSQVDPTKKASSYMTQGDGQGRGTNFNIDGGDNNSTDVGGYVSAIPMDAIGEFQVVTNQYKAEFGRSNAGFLNVVSKAGGNAFSGSAFSQFTNQSMRARSTDEGTRKDASQLHYGATLSGPMLKDRLFYMVSVERREEEAPSSTFTPEAIGFFPDAAGIKTRIDASTLYARVDWNATSWLNSTLTYSYDKNETPNQSFGLPETANGKSNTAALGSGRNETNRVGLKFTINLGSSAVWESNAVYFDYKNTIRPLSDPYGMDSYFHIRQRDSAVLRVSPSEVGYMGFDANAYQGTGIRRVQWRNDLTLNAGAHTWKMGLDLQKYRMADVVSFVPFTGIYQFAVGGLAWGPGMYAMGVQADQNVSRIILQAKGEWPGDDIRQMGAYIQDDWTITPYWSVYAGLRMDQDSCFDFMQAQAVRDLYRDIHQSSPAFIRGIRPPEDRTYVSPRLQVVYRPHGDDSAAYKFGYGKFVANVVDNITGYARTLMARANGIPGGYYGNLAAQASPSGTVIGYSDVDVKSFAKGSVWDEFSINGHHIQLPADLTPYNYAHNVNGLQDYFKHTVDGWLQPASFGTGGKQLLASDFRYPSTDTFSLSGTWRFQERHSLDLTFLFSRTRYMSTKLTADASSYRKTGVPTPELCSWGPDLDGDGRPDNMGDTLFLSNQKAETRQFTAKYAYTSPRFNVLFNLMYKDARSSCGGAGSAFDTNNNTDFYGNGAATPWKTGTLRRSHGTEALSGSFSVAYKASWGTSFGLLGTWHGPKSYDVFLGYNADLGPGTGTDNANPNTLVGTDSGYWNLDLGLRISHPFRFGKRFSVEPFVQIQNLLNNYDYGTNFAKDYYGGDGTPDPNVRRRLFGFQANLPRTAAVGLRMTF